MENKSISTYPCVMNHLRRVAFRSPPASVAFCLAFCAITISAAARPIAAPSETTLTFSSQSELVVLPVIVTKADGEHILHLNKSRFKLYENGSEQKISVFEEIIPRPTPSLSKPKTSSGEFTNAIEGEDVPRRLNIVVLDTLHTNFSDQDYARQQLIEYLRNSIKPDELTTLLELTRGGIRVVHDFTSDPAILIQALDNVEKLLNVPGGKAQAMTPLSPGVAAESASIQQMLDHIGEAANRAQKQANADSTVDALRAIAQAYGGIRGRKALIWIGADMGFSLDRPEKVPAGGSAGLQALFRRLNDANIALYPVDAGGLVSFMPGAADNVRTDPSNPALFGAILAARSQQHRDAIATMQTVAKMTGGRAFYNSNDIESAIAKASRDSGSYYLLAYYRHSSDSAPGWRKLSVTVNEPGAYVRTRSGYYIGKQTGGSGTEAEIRSALRSPLDFTALPISVRWLPDERKVDQKMRVQFEISLEPSAVTVDSNDRNHISLEFAAIAQSGDGTVLDRIGQRIEAHPTEITLKQIITQGMAYRNFLNVSRGECNVRFVVRDNLNGRIGSVTVPCICDRAILLSSYQ